MTTLAILDVGHGVCGVLYSDKSTVLIDCPPGNAVTDFLRDHVGTRRVDHIMVSHADRDHCGGLPVFLEQENGFQVGHVWINNEQDRDTDTYRQILTAFKKRRAENRPQRRSELNEQSPYEPLAVGAAEVEALLPYHEDRALSGSANRMSGVIRVSAGADRAVALFTGDIDHLSLRGIDEQTRNGLEAEWLVYPHHGGSAATDNGSFARDLLEMTRSDYVVFSFSRSRGGRPLPEVVAEVREVARVVCTQLSPLCSETEVRLGGDLFVGEPNAGASLRGRGSRCAGSILVDISGREWAAAAEHFELVGSIDGALCGGADPRLTIVGTRLSE